METIKQALLQKYPTHSFNLNKKNQEILLSSKCGTKKDFAVVVINNLESFSKKLIQLIKLSTIAEMNDTKLLIAAKEKDAKKIRKGLSTWRVDAKIILF